MSLTGPKAELSHPYHLDYMSTTPVPEPSTYGLALGGLALAGAVIRRRRATK